MNQKLEFAEPSAQEMYPDVEQKTKFDFVVSSDYYEEERPSEEDSIRYGYESAYGEDYDGEVVISDLTSVYVSTKEKVSQRTGKPYTDNTVITKLFYDTDEVVITFFDKVFNRFNPENNTVTAIGNEPLAELVKGLTGNTRDNRFVIDIDKFKETLARLDKVKCKVYSYERNGYVNYSFKVLAFSEK